MVNGYVATLRRGFEASSVDSGRCLIVTPFRRPDGEMIELEAELLSGDHVRLSDVGDSIGYLHVNGLSVTRAVLDEIKRVSRRYGVSLEGTELLIDAASQDTHGDAMHALLQTALAVTDMIQKRRPHERLRFEDAVEAYLVGQRAVYDPDYIVQGEAQSHRVRFHVDSSRRMLIQPLSPASELAAFSWSERWAYRFDDIRRRDEAWRCFAVLDDRGNRSAVWSDRALTPLRTKSNVVYWSDSAPLANALSGADRSGVSKG